MGRSDGRPARADVRVTLLVTLLLLVLTDLGLAAWQPRPERLPTHFSSRYLERYAVGQTAGAGLLILGDSELWGYGLTPAQSPAGQLSRALNGARVANLAYEAQTPINADFVVRFLLSRGVRPRAVLVELNAASFNQTAAAYDRLNPALADLAIPSLLEPFDAGRLDDAQRRRTETVGDRLNRFVAAHWLLYGSRLDLHQALFGDADLVSAIYARVRPLLQPPARGGAPYAAMYDLTPLDDANVSFAYAEHLLETLRRAAIPAVVVLPPINHALLHPYVDNAAYRANLGRLAALARAHGAGVVDLDGLLSGRDFIDNTHVTPRGAARFAHALLSSVGRVL